jgi:hypothetical protein
MTAWMKCRPFDCRCDFLIALSPPEPESPSWEHGGRTALLDAPEGSGMDCYAVRTMVEDKPNDNCTRIEEGQPIPEGMPLFYSIYAIDHDGLPDCLINLASFSAAVLHALSLGATPRPA